MIAERVAEREKCGNLKELVNTRPCRTEACRSDTVKNILIIAGKVDKDDIAGESLT